MRAAFENLAGNLDLRLTGVVTPCFWPAAWIFRCAARFRRIGMVPGGPPVGGPLPDVANHVGDAVTIRRKRRYGRRALKAIFIAILVWELALPGIGHVRAI